MISCAELHRLTHFSLSATDNGEVKQLSTAHVSFKANVRIRKIWKMVGGDMEDVTRILERIGHGDSKAANELWDHVYDELRKLAAYRLRYHGPSLKATELVHEAYLRLVDIDRVQHWECRGHFFTAAGEAMRRILIDLARKRGAKKRGGTATQIDLDVNLVADDSNSAELLAIDEALTELENHDAKAAALVKLRFYGGMKHKDAADALGMSRREADRMWLIARTWLYKQVGRNR